MCMRVAVADRIVYGIRRITSARIMIAAVPVSTSGWPLKAMTSAMPMTAPGRMYGIIAMVSRKLLTTFERRTTR